MTALGAFREETLTMLKYRHVRDDLENDIVPIHVHVEASETKGKYHDYDTFLDGEASPLLKLYLDSRRRGSPIHHGRKKSRLRRSTTTARSSETPDPPPPEG